jgi:exodeoxyribonuclease VII large subunit
VYEPRGRYQFIVSIMQPLGAGALQRAFEQLKKKLKEEGLFSSETKSELPSVPSSIGLITSSKGAALRDVHSVLQRRWPHIRLFLFPSTVQGEAAPKELRDALDRAIRFSQSSHALDVLILTRGGGSAEDLAAFNDEALARDLYECPIPIISAVGHEIDFSISDFVADLRAPTPSAAAEVAVPDRIEALGVVTARLHRILRQTRAVWKGRADEFHLRAETCLLRSPQRRFETYEQRLDLGLEAILRNMASRWKAKQDASLHWTEILRLSDPSLPLHRGYSLTVRQGDTRPIRSIADLKVGDPIETQLADGLLLSHIKEVSPHES